MRNDESAAASQLPTDPALAGVPGSRRPANAMRVGAAVLALGMTGLLVVEGSRAAFTASTDNSGNSVTAGQISLADDDSGAALFNVTGLNGGQAVERCITVTYTSADMTSDIRLHGTFGGTLFSPDLGMTAKVEVAPAVVTAGGTCANWPGSGTTTVYNANASAFPTNFTGGVQGFEDATGGAQKSYRITLTMPDNNAAMGKDATVAFTWEATAEDKPNP